MISVNIIHVGRAASTQDLLTQHAQAGAPSGTVVVADAQDAGRGARGTSWVSPMGGLWMSFLARPAVAASTGVLSLRAGLLVAEALSVFPGLPPVQLKWPNDIILTGKKLGGILCEAHWQGEQLEWVAVGVGLNVENPLPGELQTTATRLAVHRPDLTVKELIRPIADRLGGLIDGGAVLTKDELASFAMRDWLRGRDISDPIPGRVLGLRADGALEIRKPDSQRAVIRTGHVVVA